MAQRDGATATPAPLRGLRLTLVRHAQAEPLTAGADDAARALDHVRDFSLIDAPVFNVGTAQPVSVRNVSECVLAAWPNASAVGFSGKQRAGDPFSLVEDNRRLLATGFTFKVQAEEGFRRYVEWYLHQGEGAV